jgi:hydrogenase nickel incorporation protein HypB
MKITVLKNVMCKNNAVGEDNRQTFKNHNILALNLLSSPGAGKTTLLEKTLQLLHKKYRTAVIEGDLYTSRDAERLARFDIPLVQINTEGGCHLDARMVNTAMEGLPLDNLDVLFIENVGNLVCPSSFDLGENKRVLLYSVTEGEDKPSKYATMFRAANLVLINKTDLARACGIDLHVMKQEIAKINPRASVYTICARDESTLSSWISWIEENLNEVKSR